MKKRNIKILIIVVALMAFVVLIGCLFYFWYHQTHTGSCSGRVIDAVTGKPIEGAVVTYSWRYSGFLEEPWATSYETITDKEGKYFIPKQRVKRDTILLGTLQPESVLIYKDNYAVYTLWREYKKPPVGRSFGYPRKNQSYRRKNNLVKLYPWKEGESYYRHIDWIDGVTISCGKGELLRKELEEERKRAREERLAKRKRKKI